MDLTVGREGSLQAGRHSYRAALGRAGIVGGEAKREGDGATPAGAFPLRRLLYRRDRMARPATRLDAQAIGPADGWCDDPADIRNYNRPVTLPHAGRAEPLWREDGVYDLLVVLGQNDDPPVPGRGSAIFLHVARPDYAATAGCVALALADLLAVLRLVDPGDRLIVRP